MRHRNMYYATGLPGWMRFGYSPGWSGGRAGGPGPCAQYLLTGQWPTPQMAAAWQAMQSGQAAGPPGEVGLLRQQAQVLQQQLEQIQAQIAALEAEQ